MYGIARARTDTNHRFSLHRAQLVASPSIGSRPRSVVLGVRWRGIASALHFHSCTFAQADCAEHLSPSCTFAHADCAEYLFHSCTFAHGDCAEHFSHSCTFAHADCAEHLSLHGGSHQSWRTIDPRTGRLYTCTRRLTTMVRGCFRDWFTRSRRMRGVGEEKKSGTKHRVLSPPARSRIDGTLDA